MSDPVLNLISLETPAKSSDLQQEPAVGKLRGIETIIVQPLDDFSLPIRQDLTFLFFIYM